LSATVRVLRVSNLTRSERCPYRELGDRPPDDLTEGIAALRSLTLVRQGTEHGGQEYEAAVRRETEQIQIVRDLAEPTSRVNIEAIDGDL
jgi:hypothetical protein